MDSDARQKQKNFAMGAMFLALILGLITGEIIMKIADYPNLKFEEGLQRFRPNRQYHHFHASGEYYKQFEPDARTGEYKDFKYLKYTDEGLRDLPEKKGLPKVLFIGDSFVEALQVNIEEMFGHVVEKNIFGVDIINVGCASWSALQYYVWIQNNLDKIKNYKAVYQFYFANDPSDTVRYLSLADNHEDYDNISFNNYFEERIKLGDVVEMPKWKRWLRKNIKWYLLLSLTKKNIQEAIKRIKRNAALEKSMNAMGEIEASDWEVYFAGFNSPQIKKAVELDNMYIVKTYELLKSQGIDFTLVYIPVSFQVSKDENAIGRKYYTPKYIELMKDSTVFQDMLADLAVKNKFNFIDLTLPLKQYKEKHPGQMLYHVLDGHFNANGHRAVAETLEPYIKNAIHR